MKTVQQRSVLFTKPDAERLSLLHRYVTRPLEGRLLQELEDRIEHAEVIEPEDIPSDVVTMNSRVRLQDPETGEKTDYTVVFPACTDPRRRCISVLGSLGSALVGARVGDTIVYETSVGQRRVKVEAVLYQPEAAGDLYA